MKYAVAATMMIVLSGLGFPQSSMCAADNPVPVPLKIKKVSSSAGLNQTMDVDVDKLSDWVAIPGNDYSKFILYVEDRPFKDIHAVAVDIPNNRLKFDIQRTKDEASRTSWAALLGKPDSFRRDFRVSVGFENGAPLPSIAGAPTTLHFIVIHETWLWIFIVILAFALVLFLWLARSSDLLRDSGPPPPAGQRRTYSLARTQMAFWFFLVVACYVLIWLILDDRDSITPTVLGLVGISAATALGAAAVDAQKPPPAGPAPVGPASVSFLTDLLGGPQGVSLPRFQMLIWTVVLGVIFVVSVYNKLAMPEFSATLLGLMGISSGTYVGFKIPEA